MHLPQLLQHLIDHQLNKVITEERKFIDKFEIQIDCILFLKTGANPPQVFFKQSSDYFWYVNMRNNN